MSSWKQQATQSEKELKEYIEGLYRTTRQQLLNIKPATLWYYKSTNKDGTWHWEFNHLEDGHCPNNYPTSKVPAHDQVWKGRKWAKAHIQLNGKNNIVDHYLIY